MHNNHAEQALLGGIMLAPDRYDDAVEFVSTDDFYSLQHRYIWAGIEELVNNGVNPDPITVAENLERKGILDDAGGFHYLAGLQEGTASAANVGRYAIAVSNYSRERRVMQELVLSQGILSGSGDTDEKIDKVMSSLQFAAEAKDGSDGALMKDALKTWLEDLERRVENKGEFIGLSTGFADLDKKLNGLKPGKLYIIAGRPSMGKSLLGQNIFEDVTVNQEKSAAFFSMEMPLIDVMDRCACSIGRIDNSQTRRGVVDDWHKITNAAMRLQGAKAIIDDRASWTPNELRAKCRKYKRMYDIDLIIVDYLQLMRAPGYKNDRVHEIEEISRSIKALAKELNIPVVVISQLNRSVDSRADKRPVMSDLRESGAIEQDADVIMFVYRGDQYENDENKKTGVAEILIRKNRDGETGIVNLVANLHINRFDNYDGREYNPDENNFQTRGIDL